MGEGAQFKKTSGLSGWQDKFHCFIHTKGAFIFSRHVISCKIKVLVNVFFK